jgi:hypothetical protein
MLAVIAGTGAVVSVVVVVVTRATWGLRLVAGVRRLVVAMG